MSALLSGFGLGLSLIFAIGAQNAFILKQGLKRQYVFWVCAICALSDAILISAGVAGFGVLVQQYPWIEPAARYGGAAYVTLYGLQSFHSAWKTRHAMEPTGAVSGSLVRTLLICLALTWLNPHVYLDTMVLLGSVSTGYGEAKHWFGAGAILASFVFFFSLGYGARLLTPIFRRPNAWQWLEVCVGITMLVIAAALVF